MEQAVTISTDKEMIDTDFVLNYLSKESYWAKGRREDRIQVAMDNSLCFGVYVNNKQVGFARVASDYGVFAWIMDLFIAPSHQGKGHGKLLMKSILQHEDLQLISRWGLATEDAHGLYKKYGFKELESPSNFMECLVKQE